MQSKEGPVTFARHNLKAQGVTCMNEMVLYVHYSWVVHILYVHYSWVIHKYKHIYSWVVHIYIYIYIYICICIHIYIYMYIYAQPSYSVYIYKVSCIGAFAISLLFIS